MIDLQDVSKSYTAGNDIFHAVDAVSLHIGKGDFIAVTGHSGSGKTTLLSLMGGLTRPDAGIITIDSTDLWSLSDNDLSALRNRKMSFIYQFSSLIPTLTVKENILLPLVFRAGKKRAPEHALHLLETVHLQDKANAYPSQLSGGQQRRVAIARAFINNPEIVLADEPTGDLDEETETEIMELFHRMNKTERITFIMVTHSSELASRCTRRFRMSHGKLLQG
ncbi:MAG: ABC transporter ATP-binding protein [bacterium]